MWSGWKRSCDQCKETIGFLLSKAFFLRTLSPPNPCSLFFPDFLPTPCSPPVPSAFLPTSPSDPLLLSCSKTQKSFTLQRSRAPLLTISTFVLHWLPQDAHWGSGTRRQVKAARSWPQALCPLHRSPLARQQTGFRCTCRWCWAGCAFGSVQALWEGFGRSGAAALCRPRGTF